MKRLTLALCAASTLLLAACASGPVSTTAKPFDPAPDLGTVIRTPDSVAMIPTPKGCKIQAGLFGASGEMKGAAAAWDGACGSDGVATGPGTLKWVLYDAQGNRTSATWSRGPMEKGWITDQRTTYVMLIPLKAEVGRPIRVAGADAGTLPPPPEALAFFQSLMPGATYTATNEGFLAVEAQWLSGQLAGNKALMGSLPALSTTPTTGNTLLRPAATAAAQEAQTQAGLQPGTRPNVSDIKSRSEAVADSLARPATELPKAQPLEVPGFESARVDSCIRFRLVTVGKGPARDLLSVNTCPHPVIVIGRVCVESHINRPGLAVNIGGLATSQISGPVDAPGSAVGFYHLGPNAERSSTRQVFAEGLTGGTGSGEPRVKQIVFAAFGPPYVYAVGKDGYGSGESFLPVVSGLMKMDRQLEAKGFAALKKYRWDVEGRPASCALIDLREVWRASR